jgi:N-acetylneuraminic acid mutarotase
VLVAGGTNNTSGVLNSAELFNPATGKWTSTGSMNTARSGHTATLLQNGQVLVAGGDSFGTAERYNPATGTWTATSSMNTARSGNTATLLGNGKVLAAGGFVGVYPVDHSLSSAELYDPATGVWTTTGSMNTSRGFHTATLLPNGQVVVAGGFSGSGRTFTLLTNAELYMP